MSQSLRSVFALAAIPLALCIVTSPARSQAIYPNRPITMIVGAGPGATPDLQARLFAERLGAVLKTPIVVENKVGANGAIAAQAMLNAPANGYTLLWVGYSFLIINPFVYKKFPVTLDQFQPVSNVVEVCMGYFVRPSLGPTSMKEFVSYMSANPGKVNFGTAAIGGGPHLMGLKLLDETHTKAQVVSYRNSSEVVTALMGGFVDLHISPISSVEIQNVRTGRVRALATSCRGRLSQLPEVPTMTELGYPNAVITGTYQLFLPKNAPREIVDRIAQATEMVKADPFYTARVSEELGTLAPEKTPEEFARWLDKERRVWSAIVEKGKISAE